MEHELVPLKSDADPGSLLVEGGRVSEQGTLGKIGGLKPGQTRSTPRPEAPADTSTSATSRVNYAAGV